MHTEAAYDKWKAVMAGPQLSRSFVAAYVAGEYWVVAVEPEITAELPVGAQILAVNGQDVHTFVAHQSEQSLMLDPLRNRLYALYLPLPPGDTISLDFIHERQKQQVSIPKGVVIPEGDQRTKTTANVQTAILALNQVGYVHVRSFDTALLRKAAGLLRIDSRVPLPGD